MATVHVVAAIIERQGKILLAQRDEHSDLAGYWEFPGGKIETGESPERALCRELNEEMGLTHLCIAEHIATHSVTQTNRILSLQAWRVTGFSEEVQLRCHSRAVWVLPQEATEYQLAPADVPLLAAYLQRQSTATE
ncbi:CTP pyrophosphohydrolase [Leminorella richardii]|uniref:CTP pyrophosphohydrolase n=1 Tax=Leminorella richardii TaxID=158841 RepID=A0A2X4UVY9_9GAMM|nr:pyrimidine (deoxy)nucleoside triphosphate diphosphatase [Leminorella richardii]SQI39888.1 CTP pyrophosphohydrolase [Leminorella richardii]